MKKVFAGLFIAASVMSFGQTLDGSVKYGNDIFSFYYTGGNLGWNESNSWIQTNLTGSWLASVTNSGEDTAVSNLLTSAGGYTAFLGGEQVNQTTGGPNDDWSWVHGETWLYTNWNGGEPNDYNGPYSEQYLETYSNGLWNDIDESGDGDGFVAEKAVPGPSPVLAFAAGAVCLFRRRRRSSKSA
jgi:hypothetical protein